MRPPWVASTYATESGEVALPTRMRSPVAPAETVVGDVEFRQLGAARAAIGFIPGAKLGARLVQSSGRIGQAAQKLLTWQANSRLLGTRSKFWSKGMNVRGYRLGWSQGARPGRKQPGPVVWRGGLPGSHKHVFSQKSSIPWKKRKR